MALTAPQLDRLVEQLGALYEDAELRLLEHIARQLSKGLDSPAWAATKLLEVQLLQARLRGELQTLAGQSAEEVLRAIVGAYNLGQAEAVADLTAAKLAREAARGRNPVTDPAVSALLRDTLAGVLGSHPTILRAADDAYRAVILRASGITLLGAQTRRQAAQRALDEFADRGITGFTDRGGRTGEMRSYVEMAVRTTSQQAARQGHVDQLQAAGHDLVIVSDHAQECEQCRPFEGKVLSLAGVPRIDGVRVEASLAEAQREGLFHPGCRHRLKAYIPGVTKAPGKTADPAGDVARQEQRRLERGVRAWKRREAAALDPQAKANARAKVRDWSQRLREHEAANELKHQGFRSNPRAAR